MNICFLLGAGASVQHEFPTLDQLTEQIPLKIHPPLVPLYRTLLKDDSPLAVTTRSVEDILTAIDALLEARLDEPHSPRDLAYLAHESRKAIWRILSDEPRSISRLDGLQGILDLARSVTLFSLNNDLVVERWCARSDVPLETGFDADERLDTSRFHGLGDELRLVKLHGSVDWVYSGIEIERRPLRPLAGSAALTFRSPLPEAAVVFPSRIKVPRSIPLRQLLEVFQATLAEADILVIVGCRLRDGHVLDAIRYGVDRNETVRVVMVDPEPYPTLDLLVSVGIEDVDIARMGFQEALENFLPAVVEGSTDSPWDSRLLRAGSILSIHRDVDPLRTVVSAPDRPQDDLEGRITEALGPYLRDVRSDPVGGVIRAAASNGEVELEEGLDARLRAGAGLHMDGKTILFISGDRVLTKYRPPTGAVETIRSIGENPYGLLRLQDGTMIVVERTTFGVEGLGVLRVLSPGAGARVRKKRLKRGSRITASWRAVKRAVLSLRDDRHETYYQSKEFLLAQGFLNWPTSIRQLDDSTLAIVESKTVSLARWPSLEVLHESPGDFINLVDCAPLEDGLVLAESGMRGHGRLHYWRPAASPEIQEVRRLIDLAGIEVDPSGERILVSRSRPYPEGRIEVFDYAISPTGKVTLERHRSISGFHRPRYMRALPDGRWACTSKHGLVLFNLDLLLASSSRVRPPN